MKDNEWQPTETAPISKLVMVKISYGIGSPIGAIGKLLPKGWYIDEEYITEGMDMTVIGWMDLPLTHAGGHTMDWF
jgi:hypothetical protein